MDKLILGFAIILLAMVYYFDRYSKKIAKISDLEERKITYKKTLKVIGTITVIILIACIVTVVLNYILQKGENEVLRKISVFSFLAFLGSLGNVSSVVAESKKLNSYEKDKNELKNEIEEK